MLLGASRIPAIRDSALLIPATLGYALLAKGIGLVAMMPVSAMLINRVGNRKAAIIFGMVFTFSLLPLALSPNWWVLSVAQLVFGGSSGGFNLAMNSLGSDLEVRLGRPKMSTIHSWFGVGNLFGAIVGTGASSALLSPLVHFFIVSMLLAVLQIWAFRHIPAGETTATTVQQPSFSWPGWPILWLGIMLFLAGATEASVMNWVALFYEDFLKASEKIAPIGYVSYAAALLLMRFLGDRLRRSFGARNLVGSGTGIAALGVLIAIYSPTVWVATAGIFMMGAGVALTFPFIFSVAGKAGASALAVVMMLGSIGEMVSQPIMGKVVEHFQLDGGFLFITGALLLTSIMAWNSKLLKEG